MENLRVAPLHDRRADELRDAAVSWNGIMWPDGGAARRAAAETDQASLSAVRGGGVPEDRLADSMVDETDNCGAGLFRCVAVIAACELVAAIIAWAVICWW